MHYSLPTSTTYPISHNAGFPGFLKRASFRLYISRLPRNTYIPALLDGLPRSLSSLSVCLSRVISCTSRCINLHQRSLYHTPTTTLNNSPHTGEPISTCTPVSFIAIIATIVSKHYNPIQFRIPASPPPNRSSFLLGNNGFLLRKKKLLWISAMLSSYMCSQTFPPARDATNMITD